MNLVWSKIAQIVAHVHVSWMHPVKEHKTVVVGDKVRDVTRVSFLLKCYTITPLCIAGNDSSRRPAT